MAICTPSQFTDLVKNRLDGIETLGNAEFDYTGLTGNDLNDNSLYSILVIENLINGYHIAVVDVNGGWYVGANSGKVASQYRLDIVDGGSWGTSYIKLMTQRSILSGGGLSNHQWKGENFSFCRAKGPGSITPYHLNGHYTPKFNLSKSDNFDEYFLSKGTETTGVIDLTLHSLLDVNGTYFHNTGESDVIYDFYHGMTYAQVIDPNSYALTNFAHNAIPEAPAPVASDYTTLELWKGFTKRENSTKIPAIPGDVLNITIKQPTSVLNPIFLLNTQEFDYNHCKWGKRYYSITDTVNISNDLMELHCTVDYLSSWKSEIQASDQFVLYDTGAATDMIDPRLALKSSPTVQKATHVALRDDVYIENLRGGTFLVTLTGQKEVGTYSITESTMQYLLPDITTAFDQFVQGEHPFDAIVAGFKQLVGSGDVSSNIRDVRWVPFSYSTAMDGDTVVNPLKCGMYEIMNDNGVTLGGTRIGKRLSVKHADITIPWQFSDWRNGSRCTDIVLYIPFVGNISLSADQLKGQSTIRVETSLDRVTGALAYYVTAGDIVIGTYGANPGITIPLGGSQINPVSIGASIISGFATAATAGAGAGVAATLGGLGSTKPLDTCIGGIGSGAGAGINTYIECITVCHDTVEAPGASNAIHGTPSFVMKSLSGLTGYVKTVGAQVEMAGTDAEKSAVNRLLDSGIYIE